MIEAVRSACAADLTDLDYLQCLARDGLIEARGGQRLLAEQPATDWSQAIHDQSTVTLVATLDDSIVGYLELHIASGLAEVRQVFVHLEARQVGLGDWLLEAAIDHARNRACTLIEGVALPGDRDTKNLYERAGITARKIIVSQVL